MKKILFVITQSEFGGAQRFLYNFVTHLVPDSYKIMVACGADGDKSFINALGRAQIPTAVLSHLRRNINPWQDILATRELVRLIASFRPDTLFLNSSKAGVIGALAGRRFPKLHVIYRIGGWAFNEPMPGYIRQIYLWAERWTAKYKDVIIVNNQHDLDQAASLKIHPRQTVKLVYNGLDLGTMSFMDREQARGEIFRKISDNFPATAIQTFVEAKYLVGTIANFYKTKGLEYLIEAIALLPPNLRVATLVIGDGKERQSLVNLIKTRQLENKVFLLGSLPDASHYLKALDVFILSSVKEGFPWAVLEAMAAQLPVVATSVGALPEIIDSGTNGLLVPPGNASALAKVLTELLHDTEKMKTIADRAHQTVLLNFSLATMIKKIQDLL